MNLSILDELELFSKELQRYMSPHALEQLAREIGVVQRKSKYSIRKKNILMQIYGVSKSMKVLSPILFLI